MKNSQQHDSRKQAARSQSAQRKRETDFKPDTTSPRAEMEVPVVPMDAEPDHRPTDANLELWRRAQPSVHWAGAWQAKTFGFRLPAAVTTIRKGQKSPCAFGGDATRTLRKAGLDRHLTITSVFVCEHCGDVGLAIEVVDDVKHTLSFYRRGVGGDWAETDVPDEIVDVFVIIRGIVMSMVPAAAAHAAQIDASAATR